MPWRTVWEPPPGVEKIKVIPGTKDVLPEGFEKWFNHSLIKAKIREKLLSPHGTVDDEDRVKESDHLHFCPICKGWVEGKPDQHQEDTMGPMCGRRGNVTSCRRCGWEIDFNGSVS